MMAAMGPVETIAAAFVRLTVSGVLPHHAFDSLVRLTSGFVLAAVIGVSVGIAMGRSQFAEDVFLPLVSIGAPIPGLAYAPLFLLWFGLGNVTAVLLVGFVAAFPIVFNTWTGVKAVKEIWVRSAQAMGADERRLFRQVILPGALPYVGAPGISVLSQLSAGTRKIVAPASCAATILWVMPPMGPTFPSPVMVPVPAMNFPSLRSPVVSLSTTARLNIRPADGPPMLARLKSMVKSAHGASSTATPRKP